MYGNVARRCLAGLYQILDELFQPGGLPIQHLEIFLSGGGTGRFLLQKIHIADDGGQRRFEVAYGDPRRC